MTDIKETLAKWEAEIREATFDDDCMMHQPHCIFSTKDGMTGSHHKATPHDDYGAGTNWWIEQLKMSVGAVTVNDIPTDEWGAKDGYGGCWQIADSRREACIQAIVAAAEAWEAAK